jgi:hypothetical protein
MRLLADDGAGSGRTTTTTSTKPSVDVPAHKPVPATPKASRTKHAGTDFNRKPADAPTKPSLLDLHRRAMENKLAAMDRREATPTHDKKSKTPRKHVSSTPSLADQVAESVGKLRGKHTSNDGRSDRKLLDGHHVGTRDEKIAALKERQQALAATKAETQDDIDDLSDEIDDKKDKAGIVGKVADAIVPGVGMVAGLFHKENPIKAVAEQVMGLQDDKSKLEDEQDELQDQQDEIAASIKKLSDEKALNFLADVAHVTNMPKPVADIIEGSRQLPITVVDGTGADSDAAYNNVTKTIKVDSQVMDHVQETMDGLQADGIVDGDGNITNSAAFDKSDLGDAAISTTGLLVHEITHASQDHHDVIAEATEQGQLIMDGARHEAKSMSADGAERVMAHASHQAEVQRIDKVEYGAYLNQESIELQSGKTKKGFITINPDGSQLPRDEAVANIYAFTHGQPLEYGPSKGAVFSGIVKSAASTTPGQDGPGRNSPADQDPGRNSPADQDPGRNSPADVDPGRNSPGDLWAGLFSPGRNSPGDEDPGRNSPGRNSPADEDPGRNSPGSVWAGLFSPGRNSPADEDPGRNSPGRNSPADEDPGRNSPGRNSPGRNSPGGEIGAPIYSLDDLATASDSSWTLAGEASDEDEQEPVRAPAPDPAAIARLQASLNAARMARYDAAF